MVSSTTLASAAAAATSLVLPSALDVNSTTSVRAVAKTLAADVMAYYPGNDTTYADLPSPYYWWECGAMFGAMLDYSYYTNDSTYDDTIATALMAQVGPGYDYMLPSHYGDEGNDDQAFWGFAVLAAAERNFPQPASLTPAGMPSWLQLGENLWNNMITRWNATSCGGGFAWQIFASNPNGMNYRNSVSNGGIMQLSARLAALTGNATYAEWANRIWEWTSSVGLVDEYYDVWDGVDASDNCSTVNTLGFTYSSAIYLHAAAVMANITAGNASMGSTTHDTWATRASGMFSAAQSAFFTGGPTQNVSDVLWEPACEANYACNTDMKSFKGYMSRFMVASTSALPDFAETARQKIKASAAAAAQACSGGSGSTCGERWYLGGFDGFVGLGQQMSALETIQALLALEVNSTTYNQYEERSVVTRSSEVSTHTTSATTATATASSTTSANSTRPTTVYTSAAADSSAGLYSMILMGFLCVLAGVF